MERIGIVGLGRMGSAMAQRMAAEGRPVAGWTRSGRGVDGVPMAADLSALVAGADALVLSLYDDAAVAEVMEALLALDIAGKIVIDTSTVTLGVLTSRIGRIEGAGAMAVDAPISGGPELVLAGACGVFVGGSDAAAARAEAVLSAISGRIFHCGPLGTGLVMKTINNSMLQVYVQGLRELLPLARRAGLPLETALRIVSGGPAGLPMVRDRIPKILGQDDEVGFTLEAIFKDNEVFRSVVAAHGLSAPTLDRYGALREEVARLGLLDQDPAALIRAAYDMDAAR